MSAALRTVKTAPGIRQLRVAFGGVVLAGAILGALAVGTLVTAPAATPAVRTAPYADHGWSSAPAPLTAPLFQDHGWSSASSTGTSSAGTSSTGTSAADARDAARHRALRRGR